MDTKALVLTIPEACHALSVGRSTVYSLIGQGRLKAVKIGKATRITVESIRAVAAGEASNDNEAPQ